ncbi:MULTISPECIES: hypothetical protein [Clostridia]|uniref:Signal peptidase n=1 Tax=Faecalicatena fissicatena TaxID=290055 RepID=A0ABS2E9F6_9FIRM|nr:MULTISPECIES: hypothetical protein [Clostridia]MBM6738284.1 hypothetical protein [Faecalicatena fissicatena]HIX98563.1 hypothetical protein [Candidatus Dorea intestinigallinarum]
MNGKTRDWLWIIVGGYLTYTGVQLVMDVMNQKPEGYIGFVVAGVLFAVFGIGLIVYAIRNMTKPVEEELDEELSSDEDMQQEIDEIEAQDAGQTGTQSAGLTGVQSQDEEESGE